MKKLLCIATMVMSLLGIQAQNLFNVKNNIPQQDKDEYLAVLFQSFTIVSCELEVYDEEKFIEDMQKKITDTTYVISVEYVKKVEVKFNDSTYFFQGYVYSSPFEYGDSTYCCDFVQMDDGWNGWDISDFQKLPRMKVVLDSLIKKTPFTPYAGDDPDTD